MDEHIRKNISSILYRFRRVCLSEEFFYGLVILFKGLYEEQLCEIIFNMDKWFRMNFRSKIRF